MENNYKRLQTEPIVSNEKSIPYWKECGALMTRYFKNGSFLLLDIDGVVCKADSLDYPEITTPRIIAPVKALETLGVKVGIATSRGHHIVEHLSFEHGLNLAGPAILEEGQVLVLNGEKKYLTSPNHLKFIKSIRRTLMMHPSFQSSWQMVKTRYETEGLVTFCPGDTQWQGECRASFWFFSNEKGNEDELIRSMFQPTLSKLAVIHELDYKNDLSVSIGRMSVGNLGIMSIKGKKEGQPINKSAASNFLTDPWIFVADGFGDTTLAFVTKNFGGCVIGIEGNLDDSDEPKSFLRNADYVLSNPQEFAKALEYVASCLNY